MVSSEFSLVPSVDIRDEHQVSEMVPMVFSDNMTDLMAWGRETGLLSAGVDGRKLTLGEVAKSWDTTMLKEGEQSTFAQIAGGITGLLFGAIFLYCCWREGCGWYKRRRAEECLQDTVRETMDSVMQARYQRGQGGRPDSVRIQADDPEQNPSSPLVSAEPPVTRTRTYVTTGDQGPHYPDLTASAPAN